MIVSQKCNCCVHDPVCYVKNEYLAAINTVAVSGFTTGPNRTKSVQDVDFLQVSIKCKHFYPHSGGRQE